MQNKSNLVCGQLVYVKFILLTIVHAGIRDYAYSVSDKRHHGLIDQFPLVKPVLNTFTPDHSSNSHELEVKSGEFVWLLGEFDVNWTIVRKVIAIDPSGTLVLDKKQGIVPSRYIDLHWSCTQFSPVDEVTIPDFNRHTS